MTFGRRSRVNASIKRARVKASIKPARDVASGNPALVNSYTYEAYLFLTKIRAISPNIEIQGLIDDLNNDPVLRELKNRESNLHAEDPTQFSSELNKTYFLNLMMWNPDCSKRIYDCFKQVLAEAQKGKNPAYGELIDHYGPFLESFEKTSEVSTRELFQELNTFGVYTHELLKKNQKKKITPSEEESLRSAIYKTKAKVEELIEFGASLTDKGTDYNLSVHSGLTNFTVVDIAARIDLTLAQIYKQIGKPNFSEAWSFIKTINASTTRRRFSPDISAPNYDQTLYSAVVTNDCQMASKLADLNFFNDHQTRTTWNLTKDRFYMLCLPTAVENKNMEMIDILLTRFKMNPNLVQNILNGTALHRAVKIKDMVPIVKKLLAHGANPCLQDLLGNTPLHLAIAANNIVIAEIILASISSHQAIELLNIQNTKGETSYELALKQGDRKMIELLKKFGGEYQPLADGAVYEIDPTSHYYFPQEENPEAQPQLNSEQPDLPIFFQGNYIGSMYQNSDGHQVIIPPSALQEDYKVVSSRQKQYIATQQLFQILEKNKPTIENYFSSNSDHNKNISRIKNLIEEGNVVLDGRLGYTALGKTTIELAADVNLKFVSVMLHAIDNHSLPHQTLNYESYLYILKKAMLANNFLLINQLLSFRNINEVDKFNAMAQSLHVAIKKKDKIVVNMILTKNPELMLVTDSSNNNWLHLALEVGDPEIFNLLLQHGALERNLHNSANDSNNTPRYLIDLLVKNKLKTYQKMSDMIDKREKEKILEHKKESCERVMKDLRDRNYLPTDELKNAIIYYLRSAIKNHNEILVENLLSQYIKQIPEIMPSLFEFNNNWLHLVVEERNPEIFNSFVKHGALKLNLHQFSNHSGITPEKLIQDTKDSKSFQKMSTIIAEYNEQIKIQKEKEKQAQALAQKEQEKEKEKEALSPKTQKSTIVTPSYSIPLFVPEPNFGDQPKIQIDISVMPSTKARENKGPVSQRNPNLADHRTRSRNNVTRQEKPKAALPFRNDNNVEKVENKKISNVVNRNDAKSESPIVSQTEIPTKENYLRAMKKIIDDSIQGNQWKRVGTFFGNEYSGLPDHIQQIKNLLDEFFKTPKIGSQFDWAFSRILEILNNLDPLKKRADFVKNFDKDQLSLGNLIKNSEQKEVDKPADNANQPKIAVQKSTQVNSQATNNKVYQELENLESPPDSLPNNFFPKLQPIYQPINRDTTSPEATSDPEERKPEKAKAKAK